MTTHRWAWLAFVVLAAVPGAVAARQSEDPARGLATSIVDRESMAAARLGDVLTFALPDGEVTGEVDWRKDRTTGRFVVGGRLDSSGSFAVAVNAEAVYGHVRRPGRPVLVFRTDAAAGMVLEEVEADAPSCKAEQHPFDPGSQAGYADFEEDCDDGTVIDVLAVYTPEALEEAGGVAEVEAAIDLAIEENNIAWANSGLARVQNLVLTWQVDFDGNNVNLGQLTDPADGILDEVHALRDAYGADLVTLVEGFGSASAWTLTTLDPSAEANAFSLAPLVSFSDMVMSHELGHLMGCCHAWGDSGCEDTLFPFSHGHRFVGNSATEWRTVMAYSPGTKIMHFSNPELSYDGHPTGVPQSELDAADNVATINASALLVSNYRCPGVCDGSNQPSDGPDCNKNAIPDACDITLGTSRDDNSNGAPDECEHPCAPASPGLVVSSDPADGADYPTIQQAVDAAVEPGTCIEIYPGLTGLYPESVVVDRGLALSFLGIDLGWGPPEVDGSTASAFDVVSTQNTDPVRFHNLTLRGHTGLRASAPTVLEQLVFGGAPTMTLALDLDSGDCTAAGLEMDATVVDGVDLAAGATLTLERSSLIGLSGTTGLVAGQAALTNVLIGGAEHGIVVLSSGELTLHHVTVASSGTGAGVDNAGGGLVSATLSIVHGNAGGDMIGVPCGEVWHSVVGSPDCSSVNGNTAADPWFRPGYVPGPDLGGPALDLGPDPSTYSGTPCLDLAGLPRLRDHDADGLAQADAGAFETNYRALDPVTNLRWVGKTDLVWDALAAAVEYHVYRSDSATLGYDDFGTCIDGMDPDRTDESFHESAVPSPGECFYYRLTGETWNGWEQTLGLATCVERSNFASCP